MRLSRRSQFPTVMVTRTRALRHIGLSAAVAGLLAIVPVPVDAQTTNLPGIVISTTPPPGAAAPPPVSPFARPQEAPPAAAAPAPKPAPKPKAAAKPKPKPPTTASADAASGRSGGAQSIIMLINDDPITALDVEQRARLNSLSANISERASANMKALVQSEATQKRFRAMVEQIVKDNQASKTREQIMAMIEQRKSQFAQQLQQEAIYSARSSMLPGMRKAALEELIEERIKLQEAKRMNVVVDDAQIDDVIKGIAERNKMNANQFAEHMKKMGVEISAMKARFKATLSWNDVVRRRFASQVTVNQREVEKFANAAASGEDDVELQLQRITLPVPGKMDQKALSERFRDADRLRQGFSGCKTAQALATKLQGAKFEDLGVRKPSSLSEPLRSHVLAAKEGEMVPPSISEGSIELYAVCSRKVIKADEKKRTEIAQDLQQKEYEIAAKGHLRNLRQEAHIECRAPECKKN